MNRPVKSKHYSIALKIGIAIVSITISLLSCEIALRYWFYGGLWRVPSSTSLRDPHPTKGWALRPNAHTYQQTVDYQVHVKTNSSGYNDTKHSIAKQEGVKRILVLGDSFMEAYQVNFSDSFCQRLQEKFKGQSVEIINMGVGGYGTTQEYITLIEDGFSFSPDLVLLFFCNNDVINNSRALSERLWKGQRVKTFGRPYLKSITADGKVNIIPPDFVKAKKWVAKSREKAEIKMEQQPWYDKVLLFSMIANACQHIITYRKLVVREYDPNLLLGIYLKQYRQFTQHGKTITPEQYVKMWQNGWNVTCKLLCLVNSECKERGVSFCLVTVPAKIQVDSDYRKLVAQRYSDFDLNFELPNNKLKNCAQKNGFLIYDILPEFKDANEVLFHKYKDRHWNKDGHKLAAELVYKHIRALNLLGY